MCKFQHDHFRNKGHLAGYDHTCNNWTTDAISYPQTNPNAAADRARAMLGHSDRDGQNTSWITSHLSQGCSKQSLINIGGAGHIYCFAANWTGHSVASMNARPSGSEPVKTSC